MTSNDLWPPRKTIGSSTQYGQPTQQIWEFSHLPFLRYPVYTVLTFWPLLTLNDLWPPQKTIGIIYAIWLTHIPNMRSLTLSLLEIPCLQDFDLLTSHDPKWPLISTKNDRDHLRNMANLHTKYEIPHIYPSWDIVFTRLLPFDLRWPQMTFDLHEKS